MIGLPPDVRNIYLIDFGMARKYIDNKGKLMKVRPGKVRFRGTYRYCASDSHKGIEYEYRVFNKTLCLILSIFEILHLTDFSFEGRHHDLICWFYGLVEMRMGYLPWYQWETDKRELYKIKKGISPYKWLRQIEPEYLNLYERLTSLFYDMTPQYGLYKQIFINLLAKNKMNVKSPFQWESISPDAADFDHLRYRSVYKQVKHGLCHTVSERAALLKKSPTATVISAKKSPDFDSSISGTETEGSASRRADRSRVVQGSLLIN
uniref:Protein kinase domain-containing protein n=1 Tax=Romanomermis culicivorax TaxID=13658 RepID=A0A915KM10_ROMCU